MIRFPARCKIGAGRFTCAFRGARSHSRGTSVMEETRKERRHAVAINSHQGNRRRHPGLRPTAHRGQRFSGDRPGGLRGPRGGWDGPGDRGKCDEHRGLGRATDARAIGQAEGPPGSRVRLKGVRGRPWGDGGEPGDSGRHVGGSARSGEAVRGGRQGGHLLVRKLANIRL